MVVKKLKPPSQLKFHCLRKLASIPLGKKRSNFLPNKEELNFFFRPLIYCKDKQQTHLCWGINDTF